LSRFHQNAFGEFGDYINGYLGDLRDKFYASNLYISTPGTYVRSVGGRTWTKQ
jgi:hypothetical protein